MSSSIDGDGSLGQLLDACAAVFDAINGGDDGATWEDVSIKERLPIVLDFARAAGAGETQCLRIAAVYRSFVGIEAV